MTYELAKQLKDAGFPQHDYTEECNLYRCIHKSGWRDGPQESVCFPRLNELIEVCVHFRLLEKEIGYWRTCGWETNLKDSIEEYGSTPEEAVAKLWLALNKK